MRFSGRCERRVRKVKGLPAHGRQSLGYTGPAPRPVGVDALLGLNQWRCCKNKNVAEEEL